MRPLYAACAFISLIALCAGTAAADVTVTNQSPWIQIDNSPTYVLLYAQSTYCPITGCTRNCRETAAAISGPVRADWHFSVQSDVRQRSGLFHH